MPLIGGRSSLVGYYTAPILSHTFKPQGGAVLQRLLGDGPHRFVTSGPHRASQKKRGATVNDPA
jgi:hypothetical protein